MGKAIYYVASLAAALGCIHLAARLGVHLLARGAPVELPDLVQLIDPMLWLIASLLFRRRYRLEPASPDVAGGALVQAIGAAGIIAGAAWLAGRTSAIELAIRAGGALDGALADQLLPPLVILLLGACLFLTRWTRLMEAEVQAPTLRVPRFPRP